MLVHRCSAHQCLPVLKTHCIPLEHRGRTVQILVRVISIEERVQETLLFGLPSGKLTRRTGLRALPSTPFNARCDGFAHSSPPSLDRTSADDAAGLLRRPLISGTLSVTAQRGCQEINRACHRFLWSGGMPGGLCVPISCRDSMAPPRDGDRMLGEGRVEESVGLPIQPNTTCQARQD